MSDNQQGIRWTASEFVEHQKTFMWYVGCVLFGAAIACGAYLLTGDLITPVSIGMVAVILAIYAGVKPKEEEYSIDANGIQIGKNSYAYTAFRSFSVVVEGNIEALYLKPNKRFAVPVSLYFPPDQGDKIVDFIGNFVPYEKSELSGVDKLMSRLKF
ncbi:hypothetical protein KC878_01370 [Candidatus Saccharibacteria bacterium]|nr:hypothetical protein [Candidatus Saccharibacteria bacterium]MCB9821133.1 hypothetical protein [Candidatus Nomurabacteria bacterium]